VPFSFAGWDDAITYLFDLAAPARTADPLLVVLDEFPYLAKAAPELPSILQREVDRFQIAENRIRLLICGSALSVMGGMLAGGAPLRGRAQLELISSRSVTAPQRTSGMPPASPRRLRACLPHSAGRPPTGVSFFPTRRRPECRNSTTGSAGRCFLR
jgi:hypothetical protein